MLSVVALAAMGATVGARGGVDAPAGSLAEGSAIERGLGAGGHAHVDVGVRFAHLLTPQVFGERTWFGCGTESCGATSWLAGVGVRLEHKWLFAELGAGYRSLHTTWVPPGEGSVGSSATLQWWQRQPKPSLTMSGIDYRVGMGVDLSVSSLLSIEIAVSASLGRFTHTTPTPPLAADDAMHAFVGASVGVRFYSAERASR